MREASLAGRRSVASCAMCANCRPIRPLPLAAPDRAAAAVHVRAAPGDAGAKAMRCRCRARREWKKRFKEISPEKTSLLQHTLDKRLPAELLAVSVV